MALNSYVTKAGGEIGRAQATQAQAAKIEPTVNMNPILIKPTSDRIAQIIVRGKPVRNMSVYEYVNYKKRAKDIVLKSFKRLANEYELIVIEGAGSLAEVNLKSHDIVNIQMAKYAHAPVILVGDIDKGGVFAWIVGTLELLTKEERRIIKGIIINKFRGDKRLLKSGIDFLEKKTKVKVLGVVPYFKDIKIPEEDSVPLEYRTQERVHSSITKLHIAVIKLPHISNFTDFDALENEKDVKLSYIDNKEQLNSANVIIIPGTKNTIRDLLWLKRCGLARQIVSIINRRGSCVLIGICGGYQMLGKSISDPEEIESTQKEIEGLGLLPIKTILRLEKILSQTEAIHIKTGIEIKGYQIHHGRTVELESFKPVFRIANKKCLDGAASLDGRTWGTYLHGIFDHYIFRRHVLNDARLRLGLKCLPVNKNSFNLEAEFDKLARLVRQNIDMKLLYKIVRNEL
jgi:adenosylcobyric acid synthase